MFYRSLTITVVLLFTCADVSAAARLRNITKASTQSQMPLIVIDAGHGGKDPGAHSTKVPKYEEKSLALKTAMMVNAHLKNMGYRTLLTRRSDIFIELKQRASIANEAKATVFVSIHYNSAPQESVSGIEVFYYQSNDENKKRANASKKLAQNTLNELIEITKAKSRGTKRGNHLVVVRETAMPAILVECGFLTNANERTKLYDPSYQRKIAHGVAKGIDTSVRRGK